MPAEVGSGSFWTGMVEYMKGGPDSLDGVLDDIEASWPHELGRAHCDRHGERPIPGPLPTADREALALTGHARRAPSSERRRTRAPRRASSRSLVAIVVVAGSRCQRRSTSCGTRTPTGSWSSASPSSSASAACSRCSGRWTGSVELAAGPLPRGRPALRVRRARRSCMLAVFLIYPVINTILISFRDARRRGLRRPRQLPSSCSPTRACCGRSATPRGGSSSSRSSR